MDAAAKAKGKAKAKAKVAALQPKAKAKVAVMKAKAKAKVVAAKAKADAAHAHIAAKAAAKQQAQQAAAAPVPAAEAMPGPVQQNTKLILILLWIFAKYSKTDVVNFVLIITTICLCTRSLCPLRPRAGRWPPTAITLPRSSIGLTHSKRKPAPPPRLSLRARANYSLPELCVCS